MDSSEHSGDHDRVVVGVDGSLRDELAVQLGAREAALRGWPLHLVHVEEVLAPLPEALAPDAVETTTAVLERASRVAAQTAAGAPVTTAGHAGRPENVLQELSRSAGLLVVGTGRKVGTAQFLYGTVSLNVASHAACPVLVVGEPVPPSPRGRVLVGVDGSRHSAPAVDVAAEEALLRGAELAVLTAWHLEVIDGYVVTEPGSPRWNQVEQHYRAVQEQALAEALAPGRDRPPLHHAVVHGSAADTLVEASREADVLVVGNRGRGGFLGKLLGSVTLRLLQASHCPVLVTRAP